MTLKDCLYRTLHRNQKPLKAIADEIGVSESYLYRSALPDPDESDTGTGCRFPLKLLVPLIRSTGEFSTLDHIENALGRVAFVLPSRLGGTRHSSARALRQHFSPEQIRRATGSATNAAFERYYRIESDELREVFSQALPSPLSHHIYAPLKNGKVAKLKH